MDFLSAFWAWWSMVHMRFEGCCKICLLRSETECSCFPQTEWSVAHTLCPWPDCVHTCKFVLLLIHQRTILAFTHNLPGHISSHQLSHMLVCRRTWQSSHSCLFQARNRDLPRPYRCLKKTKRLTDDILTANT